MLTEEGCSQAAGRDLLKQDFIGYRRAEDALARAHFARQHENRRLLLLQPVLVLPYFGKPHGKPQAVWVLESLFTQAFQGVSRRCGGRSLTIDPAVEHSVTSVCAAPVAFSNPCLCR